MLRDEIVKKIVSSTSLVPRAELRKTVGEARRARLPLAEYLLTKNIVSEEALTEAIAHHYKVGTVSLRNLTIKKDLLELIPNPLAVSHKMIAFGFEGEHIKIATLDPSDLQTLEFIRRKTGREPKVYLATPSDMREALRKYHQSLEADLQVIQHAEADTDEATLKKIAEDIPIVNFVNSILEHAVFEGASDIHVEPTERELVVRYRVDGIMRTVMTIPKRVHPGVVARVKILANLKLDEHMLPQDGRFKIAVQDEQVSLRVSIIPAYDGEKIAMRLLHESAKPLSLEELGLLPGPRTAVEEALRSPHGMVLATGPTGSGKTTTLYSILAILNQPDVHILTVEDPIEYRIPGINQSQINPRVGFTFASALRAFLRQDPDIIMVGEVRDNETAEIAIHAAMTGHLVLSSLHTNDAATTIPRLTDMGIPSFLVAFTTRIIIAQRLVRKICADCRKPFTMTAENRAEVVRLLSERRLLELMKANGIKGVSSFAKVPFFRGEGCKRCNDTGYKGRLGLYEVLSVTKEITTLINERANALEIRDAAMRAGMTTMFEDGIIKVALGITTIEEVLQATKE